MTYTYPIFPSTTILRRDRRISLAAAILIHFCFLIAGNKALVTSAEYGVELGGSSIEINLVAAPPVTAFAQIEAEAIHESPLLPAESEFFVEESFQEIQGLKPLPAAGGENAGALAEAKPGYLKNPPPHYPEISRKRGEEGLVLLLVEVSRQGRAEGVVIRKSSGFPLLDEAAAGAVRRWKFEPARIGSIPIDSKAEVPIRFRLDE